MAQQLVLQLRCHPPRMRGIQYAAASRFNNSRLGVLDRPVKPGDDSCLCRSAVGWAKAHSAVPTECQLQHEMRGHASLCPPYGTGGCDTQTCLLLLAALPPEFCCPLHALSEKRAQGRPGAGWHPQDPRANTLHTQCTREIQGNRSSGLPCAMFDGVWRALPGDECPACLRHLANWRCTLPGWARRTSARLDCSNDSQDHALWPYASAPLVRTRPGPHGVEPALLPPLMHDAACVHRSPIRGSKRRTTAPFAGSGWTTHTPEPNFGKAEYFCDGRLTEADTGTVP